MLTTLTVATEGTTPVEIEAAATKAMDLGIRHYLNEHRVGNVGELYVTAAEVGELHPWVWCRVLRRTIFGAEDRAEVQVEFGDTLPVEPGPGVGAMPGWIWS